MGLKRLLANLTGGDRTVILPDGDTIKFDQKSKGYSTNSIYNESDHPFITYGFSDEFELEPDSDDVKTEQNIKRLGGKDKPYKTDLDKQVGSRTTGISSLSARRRLEDFERISRFLFQTGEGGRFIRNQIGLQLSNPRVDAPMKGALDNLLNFGFDGGVPDPNQTEYNPLKTLIQGSLTGIVNSGDGAAREGLIPFIHSGYYDNFFSKGKATDEGMRNPNNNKLVYLGTNIGHIKKEQEDPGLLGGGFAKANKIASSINKGLMWLGGGGEELFSYVGGPDSVYGIGTTIHRRWTNTTKDVPRNITWPSPGELAIKAYEKPPAQIDTWIERFDPDDRTVTWPEKGPKIDNPNNRGLGIKNYLESLGRPGFLYDKYANKSEQRTYHRESRIGLGDPGITSKIEKDKFGHINYSTYDTRVVDKINALDIIRHEGGDLTSNKYRDLIRFRIEAVDSSEPEKSDIMLFRAFLDSFGDNYSATHNEIKYNGRGESFYTYNSFNRDIAIGFKIAAQTRWEMMPLYRKLNFLVSNTAPDYHSPSGRIRTPFIRLTVGSYLNRTPGILNSVNITWQQDYPWEIAIDSPENGNDKHMLVLPHALDVQFGFTPVHNFIPQKSITEAPFILPHHDGRDGQIRPERKWLKHKADSLESASTKNRYASPTAPYKL
tara:strand:- start:13 stop:1995 length:1983 start_codon:yes stop_codon:yes gene_type:complete